MIPDEKQMTLTHGNDDLLNCLARMDTRVAELGLARFDPSDALSHGVFMRRQSGNRNLNGYNVLRICELFAPMLTRRVLRIQPLVVPTTYYHLGMTYLNWHALDNSHREELPRKCHETCHQALAIRAEGEYFAWQHPYPMHKGDWVCEELRDDSVPDSCAHHTTRLGLLLLQVGLEFNKRDYLLAAQSAANALVHYHQWHEHEDGTVTVSYYPDTDDETINTGAEAAALFSTLPAELRTPRHTFLARGLVQMLIREQGAHGEWRYTTQRYERATRHGGDPDNHHTAMNLGSLATVLTGNVLDAEERHSASETLRRGVRFYLNSFVRDSGFSVHCLNTGREAEIAGYCEGIVALSTIQDLASFQDAELKKRISQLLPRMVGHAYKSYYDRKTADVACFHRFGKTYQVRSLRWGAALLMDATAAFLLSQQPMQSRKIA